MSTENAAISAENAAPDTGTTAPPAVSGPTPVAVASGALPADLQGTLLGIDADGSSVFALRIDASGAKQLSRAVNSGQSGEQFKDGRQVARITGTGRTAGIYEWAGKVLASLPQGHYALDGRTLETLGIDTLGSVDRGGLQQLSQLPQSEPATGRLVVFTSEPGNGGPANVEFHELDAEFKRAGGARHELPNASGIIHDLAVTEHDYLLLQLGEFADGATSWNVDSLWDAVAEAPRMPLTLSLYPRSANGRAVSHVPVGEVSAMGVINAFEADGKVVVDVPGFTGRPDLAADATHRIARITIERESGIPEVSFASQREFDGIGINPVFAGKPANVAFARAASGKAFDTLVKLDLTTGEAEEWRGSAPLSAPVVVPKGGGTSESDVWLLVVAGTQCLVLDGAKLGAGPVATLSLAEAPALSHLSFTGKTLLG